MQEFCKKHFYKLLLTLVYTALACLVYGIWSYSAWHLWYVTLIIVLLFMIAGCVIGYFWLKGDLKPQEENPDDIKPEQGMEEENKIEE